MTTRGKAVAICSASVVLIMCIGAAYQYGYEAARDECKPLPSYEIKSARSVMYESRGDAQYWRNYTRRLPK